MNVGGIEIPLWLILLFVGSLLTYWYATSCFTVWSKLGVDGPRPSPFIGNIAQMFDVKVGICASIGKWQRQYGRIFGIYYFRTPLLVVTDMDALKQIFVTDFNFFIDRWMLGGSNILHTTIKKGLFFEEGMDWKRIRRIMTPTFTSVKLRLLLDHINQSSQYLADNLLECGKNNKPAKAKRVFGAFALDVICGTAFGLDTNSQQDFEAPFIKHARSLMTFEKIIQLKLFLLGNFPPLSHLFRIFGISTFKNRDVEFFKRNISALIAERKANPDLQKQMDFLQLLMNAEADSSEDIVGALKLTTEEIAGQGIIFIIAGYETTSTALQFLTYELARHPDIQDKIVAEIEEVLMDKAEPTYEACQKLKYMEAVIKETLRFYPPLHLLSRVTNQEIKIQGVTAPAKSAIYIPLWNIMHDPENFPNPDTFKPERFLNENKSTSSTIHFLPFGFGPRQCIGMRLAILELKVALVHTLRGVKLVGATPEVLDIEDYTGLLVPQEPIQLKIIPR